MCPFAIADSGCKGTKILFAVPFFAGRAAIVTVECVTFAALKLSDRYF